MPEILKAVAYCRYSSHLQREESIKAQLRAIQMFSDENGYVLLDSYVDEAQSAKTDNRIAFQQLMEDIKSKNIKIDVVIVHKFDRFARNRYDAAVYKKFLDKNNIRLVSVTENFQDNPESVILESVLEGMAEYYSLNLSREVRKGLKENALSARTTGGRPPLGYDVDKNKKFVINPIEAEAVKLIFKMYLDGCGYSKIIQSLNSKGYKTKREQPFGKNSINSILKNEKYTGLYTYNLETPKYEKSGKPIRYGRAAADNLIQIENGVPQIISKEDFEQVQRKMTERKHKAGCYNAKEKYLLSGKIFCGECGAPYTGNKRKANATHPEYISYRCSKRNGKNKSCTNKEIRKEFIEDIVLSKLSGLIFDESLIPLLNQKINSYASEKENSIKLSKTSTETRLKDVTKQITNLVNVIAQTGSNALVERLNTLEKEQVVLNNEIHRLDREISKKMFSKQMIESLFTQAKALFEKGTLNSSKKLIDLFVERVDVYKDHIEIKLNILPQGGPPKARKDKNNPDELFNLGEINLHAKRDENEYHI